MVLLSVTCKEFLHARMKGLLLPCKASACTADFESCYASQIYIYVCVQCCSKMQNVKFSKLGNAEFGRFGSAASSSVTSRGPVWMLAHARAHRSVFTL